MPDTNANEEAALHALLTQALAMADDLGLTMVAIHLDEARAQIAGRPGVAPLIDPAALPATSD